jgi:ABC-type multidrug transport system ATPase subunit
MPSLEIHGLTRTYANGPTALSDVSLSVAEGVYGLLGPNGAGKSTLMRTIATLQRPDSGTVRFDGVDVVAEPDHVRRRLGYLPQEFGVYPRVTARRLLDHLAVLKGVGPTSERAAQVEALLELTNLRRHRDRPVAHFSGGMRRRFGIAQALLGDPALVIVDEPTAGLDPEERIRFQNLLSKIAEDRVVLLSTHIVDDVRTLCSRMAILAGGRVRLEGEPARLVDRLEGRVWEKIVGKEAVDEHRRRTNLISARLLAGRIRLRVEAAARPEAGFEPVAPDLEDLYFTTLREAEAGDPALRGLAG